MERNDAALGAVLSKGLASGQPAGGCPSLEEIAALVDGTPADAERERLLGHLALCDDCRAIFVASSQLAGAAPAAEKRRNFAVPLALAAAAVLAIALTLQFAPLSTDKRMVARTGEPVAAPAAPPGEGMATAPVAGEVAARAAKDAPAPTAGKAAAPARRGAPDGAALARLLVKKGDPASLAAQAAATEKSFGFAVKADARSLAFRVGANLMNLQVALLAEDGDRAQAQVARLAPLLESVAANPDLGGVERITERLERGEVPSGLTRACAELEQLVPGRQLPYARLGAWAQGARLAARTGNRDYLAAGVPRYFGGRVAEDAMPLGAVAALSSLDRELKRQGNIDLEAVERGVTSLLEQF